MSSADQIGRDRELVTAAKRDPEAFGAIFDLYYNKILSYALRRVGDVDLAQDITAETFAKALKNLWRFTWRGVPLSAWLYRIAGNEIRMHLRKMPQRSVSLELLIENGFDPEDQAAKEEKAQLEAAITQDEAFTRVAQALHELPPRYAEVLALRYMEGREFAEIAQIIGVREVSVRSLVSRGLVKLREILEAQAQQMTIESITTSESQSALSA